LPRSVLSFFGPDGLSPQPGFNPLNPFRNRGPEAASREIIEAAKRGDCEGDIWSRVSLDPEEELESYYKVSRKAELCKDFASAEMWVLDYVYTPEKAYLLFGSRGLKSALGKPAPLIAVELHYINGRWRVVEFFPTEEGFRIGRQLAWILKPSL
jgi:hypothetical protein